jgi:hypothetical protein
VATTSWRTATWWSCGRDCAGLHREAVRTGPTLRNVRVMDIREIRYLSDPEATTRYGTGHAGGVIHVLLK